MGRKSEVRQIGEYWYQVQQLKVRKQHEVLERLANRFGDPVAELIAGLGTDPEKAIAGDLSARKAGEALGALLKSLRGDDINWLVDQISPHVKYQTDELREASPTVFAPIPDWDDHFADCILDEFKLLAFALELNFASFFGALGGLKNAAHKFVTPTNQAPSK